MIQVLERAFQILEWLARAGSPPRQLGEIARLIGVSPAACSHILKTMVRYGYVIQPVPRKGYCLGPMAAMLGRHHNPHSMLIQIGQPLVERVAADTGETTLLACLYRSRRLILCQAEGEQTIRVSSDAVVLEDIYGTATGRVLLAFLPDAEREAILLEAPPTGVAWETAATTGEIQAALAETRQTGYVINPNHEAMLQMAFPVYQGETVCAAIGCFAPVYRCDDAHREQMSAVLKSAACELSGKVSGTGMRRKGTES